MRLVGTDDHHGNIHWYNADNANGFFVHFKEITGGTYLIGWWDSYADYLHRTAEYEGYIEVPNADQVRDIAMDWIEAFWLEGGC